MSWNLATSSYHTCPISGRLVAEASVGSCMLAFDGQNTGVPAKVLILCWKLRKIYLFKLVYEIL